MMIMTTTPKNYEQPMNSNFFISRRDFSTIISFVFYLSLSLIYFHGTIFNITHKMFVPSGDPETFVWFLNWFPFSMRHRLDPFFTNYIWYPYGYSLSWATSIPFLSFLMYPITTAWGATLSWNILSLLAPAVDSTSAFVLFRYLFKNEPSSLLGGYIYGFSSYILGQQLGHVNLTWVPLVPLSILFSVMYVRRQIGKLKFVLILSLIIAAQFGISLEVLATSSLFAIISVIAFIVALKEQRKDVISLIPLIAISFIIASIMNSGMVISLIKWHNSVPGIINSPIYFSSDILNYIIPTPVTMIGGGLLSEISRNFTGNYSEEGAYLSIPLLIVMAFAVRDYIISDRRAGQSILFIIVVVFIFSLGPLLHVDGIITNYILPWFFFGQAPLIKHALPIRFTNYLFLLVGLVVARWLSSAGTGRERYASVIFSILFIIPNVNYYTWGNPKVPKIFTSSKILENKVVLVFPFGNEGSSMLWQEKSGMKFKMAGGYAGFTPEWFSESSLSSPMYGGSAGGKFLPLFREYCFKSDINYIVLCPGTPKIIKRYIDMEGYYQKTYGSCRYYHIKK